MTWLAVVPEAQPEQRLATTADPLAITAELEPWGVRFERWPVPADPNADVLSAYVTEVERLRAEGYGTIDVVRVAHDPEDPAWTEKARALREKFWEEHTHGEDEVRFFAEGSAVFYLRLGIRVYCLLCEAGDLVSVPAGTRHWFDVGLQPHFTAFRFFRSQDGWIGDFTSDVIARRFPSFDELASEAKAAAAVAPERAFPEASAPEASAPEASAPEASAPEASAPHPT